MNMTQTVIDYLNRKPNFTEAAFVTTYEVWVNSRPLTVEVHDRGEGTDNLRWTVAAYWSGTLEADRNTATDNYTLGNPEATLEEALRNPHWYKFRSED